MAGKRTSINTKIQLYLVGSAIILYILAFIIISQRSRIQSLQDAKKITDAYTEKYASYTKSLLLTQFEITRSLCKTFETYKSIPEESRRKLFMELMVNHLKSSDGIKAIWTTWEPHSIDNLDAQYVLKHGSTVLGNFAVLYYKQNGQVLLDTTMETNPDAVFDGDYYTIPKNTLRETILDPYFYSYSKNNQNEILETSYIVPIISGYKFLGVLGIDIELTDFKDITDNIAPFEGSFSFIVSNNGTLVAHPYLSWIGKSINQYDASWDSVYKINENISKGKAFSFVHKNSETGEKLYYSFSPIIIGNTNTPWSIAIAAPLRVINHEAQVNFEISMIIGLIVLLFLFVLSYILSRNITRPLERIDFLLQQLNKADVSELEKISQKNKDEIGDIAASAKTLIEWLNTTGDFAKKLGQGNFEADYKLLDENDVLGRSLVELRDKLILAKKEEDERKTEHEQRNWSTTGIAKFSEIARHHSAGIIDFSYQIISNLVNYVDASLGGIYILDKTNPDKPILELTGSVAYDRKKSIKKIIPVGDGLIGTCALEMRKIYMTDLPPDYVKISSGLGSTNPTNLLIVPLILNDELFGVLELAALHKFKNYQIEFVEEVSKIIASTINNIRINEQTIRLLEDSKQVTEQLSQHDEEMRQNYEELQTTQEELIKTKTISDQKIKHLRSILDAIPYAIVHLNDQGNIVDVNHTFSVLSGYKPDEILYSSYRFIFKDLSFEKITGGEKINISLYDKDSLPLPVDIKSILIEKEDSLEYLLIINEPSE